MAMMTARKVLIELLRHEGVEYVFGIPGATEILFMDALGAPDIHYILAFHVFNCRGNK
ncbi:MAG: thiamine pyrophosphate-binding protein [Syntrophorhabdales bacterium]|jgi:thiamine pyrophosphate-dependent acetolactate synthase large subunit-like protein